MLTLAQALDRTVQEMIDEIPKETSSRMIGYRFEPNGENKRHLVFFFKKRNFKSLQDLFTLEEIAEKFLYYTGSGFADHDRSVTFYNVQDLYHKKLLAELDDARLTRDEKRIRAIKLELEADLVDLEEIQG